MPVITRRNIFLLQRSGLAGSLCLTLLLAGCSTIVPNEDQANRHLQTSSVPQQSPAASNDIPDVVATAPLVTAPRPESDPELFSVVAQDIPLRELLFQLARDAGINVDMAPGLSGTITLNAINQSLPQILERIARQAEIRWRYDDIGNLVIEPDSPVWRNYTVDYVNVSRQAETEASISTAINSNVGGNNAGGGQGGGANGQNTSVATITQNFNNNFWQTLESNLQTYLGASDSDLEPENQPIIINPESGVVSVQASYSQHEEIAEFINSVQTRSLHQVLIEATIVEVDLGDDFQSGVDWELIDNNNDSVSFLQNVTNPTLENDDSFANILTIQRHTDQYAISSALSMLSQFGELQVLSSPKIMALNNQAAMLRVVDNRVYFNIEVQPSQVSNGVITPATFTTNINTVPVGFVMTITPQIASNDQVTLNVRPTISRVLQFVNDPNPQLAAAGVENQIPEIQVREFESILKLYDGQVAILGGLMQDSLRSENRGVPGLSRLPVVRNLFGYRQESESKSELIIFIRPVIVRQPSLDGDLSEYREFLPTGELQRRNLISPQQTLSP